MMIKRMCDRCKKEMPLNMALADYVPPTYTISKNDPNSLFIQIDLCEECCDKLTKWLKKEDKLED